MERGMRRGTAIATTVQAVAAVAECPLGYERHFALSVGPENCQAWASPRWTSGGRGRPLAHLMICTPMPEMMPETSSVAAIRIKNGLLRIFPAMKKQSPRKPLKRMKSAYL